MFYLVSLLFNSQIVFYYYYNYYYYYYYYIYIKTLHYLLLHFLMQFHFLETFLSLRVRLPANAVCSAVERLSDPEGDGPVFSVASTFPATQYRKGKCEFRRIHRFSTTRISHFQLDVFMSVFTITVVRMGLSSQSLVERSENVNFKSPIDLQEKRIIRSAPFRGMFPRTKSIDGIQITHFHD